MRGRGRQDERIIKVIQRSTGLQNAEPVEACDSGSNLAPVTRRCGRHTTGYCEPITGFTRAHVCGEESLLLKDEGRPPPPSVRCGSEDA